VGSAARNRKGHGCHRIEYLEQWAKRPREAWINSVFASEWGIMEGGSKLIPLAVSHTMEIIFYLGLCHFIIYFLILRHFGIA
jgi:hypothetical protein